MLLALIIVSITVLGQNKLRTDGNAFEVSLGKYNTYTKEWKYTTITCDIDFILQENILLMYDDAHSMYKIGQSLGERKNAEYQMVAWKARDENDRPCEVKLVSWANKGHLVIEIHYPQTQLIYKTYPKN